MPLNRKIHGSTSQHRTGGATPPDQVDVYWRNTFR